MDSMLQTFKATSILVAGADADCAVCRPGCIGCCRSPAVTATTIRENTIALSGIEDKDLLFFSHSNVALSHLPYMVALERQAPACAEHLSKTPYTCIISDA